MIVRTSIAPQVQRRCVGEPDHLRGLTWSCLPGWSGCRGCRAASALGGVRRAEWEHCRWRVGRCVGTKTSRAPCIPGESRAHQSRPGNFRGELLGRRWWRPRGGSPRATQASRQSGLGVSVCKWHQQPLGAGLARGISFRACGPVGLPRGMVHVPPSPRAPCRHCFGCPGEVACSCLARSARVAPRRSHSARVAQHLRERHVYAVRLSRRLASVRLPRRALGGAGSFLVLTAPPVRLRCCRPQGHGLRLARVL